VRKTAVNRVIWGMDMEFGSLNFVYHSATIIGDEMKGKRESL